MKPTKEQLERFVKSLGKRVIGTTRKGETIHGIIVGLQIHEIKGAPFEIQVEYGSYYCVEFTTPTESETP